MKEVNVQSTRAFGFLSGFGNNSEVRLRRGS